MGFRHIWMPCKMYERHLILCSCFYTLYFIIGTNSWMVPLHLNRHYGTKFKWNGMQNITKKWEDTKMALIIRSQEILIFTRNIYDAEKKKRQQVEWKWPTPKRSKPLVEMVENESIISVNGILPLSCKMYVCFFFLWLLHRCGDR